MFYSQDGGGHFLFRMFSSSNECTKKNIEPLVSLSHFFYFVFFFDDDVDHDSPDV